MSPAEKALSFLMKLNHIQEQEYAQLVQNKIEPELLAIFQEYCQELVPEEDPELVGTLVHLMITGFLIRDSQEEQSPIPSKIQLADA